MRAGLPFFVFVSAGVKGWMHWTKVGTVAEYETAKELAMRFYRTGHEGFSVEIRHDGEAVWGPYVKGSTRTPVEQ